MTSILYYITGHGYGHAVRSNLVIRALQEADPDVRIYVRTTVPRWLFQNTDRRVVYAKRCLDIGIIQPNGLEMDLGATLRACEALHGQVRALVRDEAEFIKSQRIDLIVGDIPPLAFEIAARANVASVAVTNFTWDVIYRAYACAYPGFEPLVQEMTRFYAKATLALALPYSCDMSMFARREPIPWIGRRSRMTREQARAALGLPFDRTIVLLSFGGIGFDDLPWQRLSGLSEYFFVATGSSQRSGDNLRVLSVAQHGYADLLRAADAVITKPGYGIVADVLAQRLPLLYTERGDFPEYPCLVQALTELATAEFIPQADLLSGEIRPYLNRLMSKKPHWPAVALSGAQVAAERILDLLHGRAK